MRQFIATYWFWISALALLNAAVWIGAEYLFSDALRSDAAGRWSVRMYLASGLLLFDNLCVLWWYAHATHQHVEITRAQLGFSRAEHRIAHKPFAVVERIESEDGRRYSYCLRNIGAGLAVNVWLIELTPQGPPAKQTLGALGPGAQRLLPEAVRARIGDSEGLQPFLLLAEGLITRTAQWTATLNFKERKSGGEMYTEPFEIPVTEHARTIDRVLDDEWPRMRRALLDAGAGV